MNVWGDDPWADHAVPSDVQKKGVGAESAVPATTTVLNGFEDEAGWGDFESSGENVWREDPWAEANGHVNEQLKEEAADLPVTAVAEVEEETHRTETIEEDEGKVLESLQGAISQDLTLDHEAASVKASVDEESSRSGSTVVPDAHHTFEMEDEVRKEEEVVGAQDHHTRPLSSSSGVTDTTETRSVCSDRISLEQGIPDRQTQDEDSHEQITKARNELKEDGYGQEEEFEEAQMEEAISAPPASQAKAKAAQGPEFEVDLGLLDKLLKPRAKRKKDTEQASEELIDSTSTRKMWYRLSRHQTLRGFLSGDVDDAHVRVAWPSSRIRGETVKIVARWAAEDRMHGRTVFGGGPRAAFGWDEPRESGNAHDAGAPQVPPTQCRFSHSRKPSLSTKTTAVAASPVASFGWSTSPISPSFQNMSGASLAASPINTNADNPWRRSMPTRPSSLQISSASLDAVFASEQKKGNVQLTPISPLIAASSAPAKTGLAIDTALASQSTDPANDDDDEWGEMVHSPPPPESPALAPPPQQLAPAAGLVAGKQDKQDVLLPQKTRKPSLISPVSSTKVIPEAPLSPARRAAFNAARVTRTLSSQHETEDASPAHDDAHSFEDPTKVKLRKTSQIAETTLASSEQVIIPPAPSVAPRFTSTALALPKPSSLVPPALEATKDDFSLFGSMYGDSQQTATSSTVVGTATKPILSPLESQRVQNFLAQLPDLSYMFR